MNSKINPKLEEGDRVVLIVMSDPYSPVTVGTKGTVIGKGSDPWSKEPLYYVEWDNGRTLNLVGDEDVWLKDDESIIKEEVGASPTSLSKIMSTVGPIPKTKMSSSNVIKRILRSEGIPFFNINDGIDLNTELKRLVDKIRFYEYFLSFKRDKDGRGFNFEGLLAGLTGGKPIISQRKEDIKIGDKYYSVKLTQPGERFDLGSLSSGFKAAKIKLIEDGYEIDDLKRPIDLMNMGREFDNYKRIMLETSFVVGEYDNTSGNDSNSESLNWIFSILNENDISYCVTDTESLIKLVIDNYKTGKGNYSISIPQDKVGGFCNRITFPEVSDKEIKNLHYKKDSSRKDDRISDLFGSYAKNIRFDIIQYIRKNPDLFLKRVIDLYGDRLARIMKEKGLIDLPSQMDESKKDLSDVLRTKDIDPSEMEDLISQLTDEDITDLVLRNLERKFLKSGNPRTNARQYLERLVNSVKNRENTSFEDDDYDVEDELVYGGEEPEKSVIGKKAFKKELLPLQVELLKLQEHIKETGKSIAVVFEGRDTAGKGSTIRTITKYLDPKYYSVVALGIPTPEERKDWFGRYSQHIEPGKITFFDRSWYNRGIVEPVMGYGEEGEYEEFMNTVNDFEKSLVSKGVDLYKFWLSITPKTQEKRFDLRKSSPLKYWKFSPNDEKSLEKWDDYTEYKEKVFDLAKGEVPWTVVDTNDKRIGSLNLLRHILKNSDYPDKNEGTIGDTYPESITTINENFIDDMKPLLPILQSDDGGHIFNFLIALRDSGIVNMMQSPDFTWSGRDFLEKYLKIQELQDSYQQIEDEDEKENLLQLAEKSQQVMISAAFRNLQDKEQELSTNNINRELRKLGPLALRYFMMKL